MKKDAIGNRMKENYEQRSNYKLVRRMPVIIRLDGKAFHTLTRRHCTKPFDEKLRKAILFATFNLFEEIQGIKCAYLQSDEISLLLTDYDDLRSEAAFDYKLQKLISISASIMSVGFSSEFGRAGYFDSRAFNIPKEEVNNYFIWRQSDWFRNSIQLLAQSHFSHNELHKKNKVMMLKMLESKDVYWDKLDDHNKYGTFMYRKGNERIVEFNRQFNGDNLINELVGL